MNQSSSRRSWSQFIAGVLFAIVFVIVIGLVIAPKIFQETLKETWNEFRGMAQDIWNDIFGPPPVRTIEVARPGIDKIRNLGRLDTLELKLATAVTVQNKRTVGVETLVYGVCGRAIIGVELAGLEAQNVLVKGDAITLTLPPIQVFSVNPTMDWNIAEKEEYALEEGERKAAIMSSCSYAYKWDAPWPYEKTKELPAQAEEQAMAQFKLLANQEHILQRAQQNAEKTLERFLKSAGYNQVTIQFEN